MPIRQLTDTDVEIYRVLRLHCLRESPHAFTNSYEEFSQRTLDSIAQQFRSRENFTLGAFENDQLVGMVGFYRENALKLRHKGYVVSMYVLPEYRSHGIARALLIEAIDRAKRLPDLKQLLLGVVVTQTTARRLYESLGFVVYGREPDAVKIDDEYFDEEFMLLKL
ncbi:MAG: GNAT family N-acetyltransferase [Chloroflexi bacterium]|nr:GNAT family N-acetyltransferase [Chloroflexota bacterium]